MILFPSNLMLNCKQREKEGEERKLFHIKALKQLSDKICIYSQPHLYSATSLPKIPFVLEIRNYRATEETWPQEKHSETQRMCHCSH